MPFRFILCLILTLSFVTPASSAEVKLSLRHLGASSGFSNNFITTLYKDNSGLLWIGTSAGLYRYDGYSARRVADRIGTDSSVITGYINDIQEDALGRLWLRVGTDFGIYDPMSESVCNNVNDYLKPFGIEGYLTSVLTDSNGDVWLALEGQGLFRLSLADEQLEQVKGEVFNSAAVTDLVESNGKVIGITDSSLVISANPGNMTSEILSASPDGGDGKVTHYDLYADRTNKLWLITNERLRLFDPSTKRWLTDSLPKQGCDGVMKGLYHDSKGNLWVARDHHGIERLVRRNGVYSFESVEVSGDFNPANTVTSILEDEYGTLWFGTYKVGLYSYNESVNKFTLEAFPDVNCMVPGRNNDMWIGTDNSGLWYWNISTNERKALVDMSEGGAPKAITSLVYSTDGTLYVGAFSRGIRIYRNGGFSYLSTGSELDHSYPWSMVFDKNHRLWVGTLGGGLYCYDPTSGDIRYFGEHENGLSSNFVLSVIVSRDGLTYVGTARGIDVYNPANDNLVRVDSQTNKLNNISVIQLFEDSRGLLWIATSVGLKVLDRSRDKVYDVSTLSSSYASYILGVTEDMGGSIWVSDGSRLVNLKINYDNNTGEFSTARRIYDSRDGLQNCDFNQRSFARLPEGELAVGGLFGINRFSPTNIRFNTAKPKVMFTDLHMGNLPVHIGEKIDGRVVLKRAVGSGYGLEFSHNPKEFTVFFGSDDYALPEKTRFYYKLKGYSDEWVECPEGINHVTYTNLSPGNYRLLVKAVNGDGYESENPAELPIKVYPAFWGSIWAWALYLFLIVGVVWCIIRVVRERERRHFERKRHEDALRKQEEVNQLKFQFFTNVSHELRTPLTLIVSPLEEMIKETTDERQTKRLSLMRNNAMTLLSLVNQLLDFRKNEMVGLQLNPSEGDIVAFARGVCTSFMNLSDRKNINLTFYSDCDSIELMFDEDKMEKIFMNLLGNAFKFTPSGGRIDVSIEHIGEENPILRIKISDTGIGIKDKDKEHIFERFYQVYDQGDSHPGMGSGIGLSMVSEYVKLHEGTIRVTDNVERGSVFIIDIPIKRIADTLVQHKKILTDTQLEVVEYKEVDEEPKTSDKLRGESAIKIALVIDDNPDMTEMLKDSLGNEYEVLTASDGHEALEVVASTKPDIILTDLMMPGMNGIELCRRLKSDKATVSIPIIIITAKHDLGVKLEGLTIGADDYITKPFNLDVLRLRMRRLVTLSVKGVRRSLIEPEPEDIEITPLDEKFIEKAMKYVSDNLDRSDLSVEELSAALGMSRVRLYKKIKQLTGKTPIEFIRVIRLKRAAQMLRESQLNISEVAYQTGFNNPKIFSKYFKEEFGILPSAYQDREGKETNYTV